MKVTLKIDSSREVPVYRISPAEATDSDAWNWNAGGGCYVFQSRYVALIQRSSTAPTNPGKWTVATGIAEDENELHDPIGLLRETFEELVMVNAKKALLIPHFGAENAETNALAQCVTREQAKILNLSTQSEQTLSVEWPHQNWLPLVTVELPGRPAVSRRAYVHTFEKTRSVNVIFVLEVPHQAAEGIEFFDGELDTSNSESPRPLRRTIRAFDLLSHVWEEHEITPHARGCLEWIKKGISL